MLLTYLNEHAISQSAFAAALGLSRGYMSDLACGTKRPSLQLALRIHLVTGGRVTLKSWFSDEELAAFRNEALVIRPQMVADVKRAS